MSNYSFSCFVNTSHSSLSDFAWDIDPFDSNFDAAGYAISATLILFLLLGVPWNLLVIAAIIKKKLYAKSNIILLLNLIVTNLLVALLIMPFSIVSGIIGEYAFGDTDRIRCFVCQTGALTILLPIVSFHTMALMAVDRFIYLKRPLKYPSIITPKTTIVAMFAVWALCTALVIPPFFGFGEIQFSSTIATCIPHVSESTPIAPNYYYWILITIEALVPILTLFILYWWIFYIIRSSLVRRLKRSKSFGTKSTIVLTESKKHSQSQMRLVWLFGAIFIANVLTGTPFVALVVSSAILGPTNIPPIAFTISYLLVFSQTVIHPILQVCLIRDISQAISGYFVALGRVMCCIKKDSKPSAGRPAEHNLVSSSTNKELFSPVIILDCEPIWSSPV